MIESPTELIPVIGAMDRTIDMAMSTIGAGNLSTKEQIIAEQQEAIRELSTPVLQVRDGLLILPLVGVVDTARARQLTESLLVAIRDRRASVAVIDITGVPIVDSKVANHLVQTVRAAPLMGADVVVTGSSAEIAQTLVAIGADLGDINTLVDLQSGSEAASRIHGGAS
jgi:rsbT co-antagonist protein RsbR